MSLFSALNCLPHNPEAKPNHTDRIQVQAVLTKFLPSMPHTPPNNLGYHVSGNWFGWRWFFPTAQGKRETSARAQNIAKDHYAGASYGPNGPEHYSV